MIKEKRVDNSVVVETFDPSSDSVANLSCAPYQRQVSIRKI